MLKLKAPTILERLWLGGLVAFIMHSLMIAAIALGMNYRGGMKKQIFDQNDFLVAVMFDVGAQSGEEGDSVEGALSSLSEGASDPTPIKAPEESTYLIQKKTSIKSGKKTAIVVSDARSLSSSTAVSIEAASSPSFSNPPPIYPLEARRKKLQGVVQIKISVSPEGTVDTATMVPPRISPILENAALAAVRQWKFKPGIKTLEVPIEFKLET
ncbi:MAG: energy transducer TonB [Alphaproteobacteria bacterium]|nr:energy transducer TonB [Alphaproteobacteria bacterium]